METPDDPLHDVVEDAWLGLDSNLTVLGTLTRTARELCGHDPIGQPLRSALAPLLSGDDLQTLLSAANAALADRPRAERRLPAVSVVMPRALDGREATRICEPRLHPGRGAFALLIGLHDITEQLRQRASLEHLQATSALALAVLGTDPLALQNFLQNANVSVALIKSLLHLPARDPAAFRQKLERILAEVLALRGEAADLGLAAIADGARDFEVAIANVAMAQNAGGDDFLPLAARLNDLFMRITAATAMVERREIKRARPREVPQTWHVAAESRLRSQALELALKHERQIDTVLIGLEHVPEHLQGSVDGMLAHLLGNAVEHGIESVEQRLAQGKRASGTLTIQLTATDDSLELIVQDDGQGFDTAKLGRAAVARGLLTEETLQKTEARSLIGLIFRPGFSTAPVSAPGRGLGMEFLRELVARLDGRITVATKSRQYTRFRIELPLRSHARRKSSRDAA
ncbi:MAG: ATP-binding protein [Steroidobacteraceae bacterium]